jgi:hypothetical protein
MAILSKKKFTAYGSWLCSIGKRKKPAINKKSGHRIPRASRTEKFALQNLPPSPWNGNAVCLAKDQVTREARTRTTKRYVTLDSLFFSYSLEIEEAFHQ